jgi:hypothetical protein
MMRSSRKPQSKANKPSLRDKLSANFLAAFESDFAENGVAAIEQLRLKSPEKYSEIAARLIAAVEPKPDGFAECKSMPDVARKLLKSVGCDEALVSDQMIEEALAANDAFIARLQAIRDAAQGPMQ